METDHPQVAPSFIAKSENGRDQSLADGPPPPFASSSLSPATMQRPLPHHSQSFSPTHSSRPSLAGSVGEHSADGEVDRQKKPSRDGYWKMKEAEAASSASINKSHEYTPIPNLSHTANTDATQQELLHTPITGSLPPLPHIDSSYTSVAVSNHNAHTIQPKKRGRKKVSPPPLMTTKGISLVFRRPPNATPGHSTTSDTQSVPVASGSGYTQNSRASTPDQSGNVSVSAEGEDSASKKRRTEASLSGGRSTRNRPSPAGTPLTGSPAPSGTGALSIFAAPPPTEGLPEALQSAIPHGLTNGLAEVPPIPDADSIRKEAAAGFESRLRSRTVLAGQRRDGGERTGVSASGKDVRVGGTARTSEKTTNANTPTTIAAKKKGKGKADVEIPNQDFCSACRGIGRFLCCDGCPRSFHFMCLEPPLRIDELPEEEIWYCKQCKAELKEGNGTPPTKERELKPIPMTFKQLTKKVNSENPRQFRLPTDLISYFTGVGEAPHGEYVDAEGARMKYDRKGFQEDRDPSRLRDNKNKPIQCFHCGGSALPHHALTTDPESPWRMIVSCDYCPLSWHLDCLDPPLSSMPNPAKKWMCPNHTEQVLPRRRTIRNDIETVDVDSRNQPNNGNIVVIPEPEPPKGPALDYEDMVINRKKFRVPEKIIKLDFWEKCKTRAISRPSQEDMDAANLVLSLGIQHSHEPEKNQDGDMDIDVADDDNTHDPFPTPKSPDSTTNHNDKSQNAVKQPRIVLRMPAK